MLGGIVVLKKAKIFLLSIALVLFLPLCVSAKGIKDIYIFKGKTCDFCANALKFFTSLKSNSSYKDKFNLIEYEVWYDEENKSLASRVAEEMGKEFGGVPFIVIGDETFDDYTSSYDSDIKKAIDDYYESDDTEDVVASLIAKEGFNVTPESTIEVTASSNADTIIGIIIIVVAVLGFGYVIYLSRKDSSSKVKQANTKKAHKKTK